MTILVMPPMEHLRLLLKCVIVVSLSYLIVTYPVKEVPATARPVQKDHILSLFKKAEASKEVVTDSKPKEVPVAAPEPPKIVEAPKVVEVPPPAPAPVVEAPKPVTPPAPAITGTKTDWMRLAGIPVNDWPAVNSIITRESGWNPNAVNKSSGACGLGQQLPCGKWPHTWNDPVGALIDATSYVNARYGGWWGALNFWDSHNWY